MAEYRLKNKDKIQKQMAEYRAKNREKRRLYCIEYKARNKEKVAAYNSKYKTENRTQVNSMNNWRHAQKLLRTPRWLTLEHRRQVREVYNRCPEGSHVDHIVPILGENVSGLHVPWNLQILSMRENQSKKNKFDGTYDNNSWKKESA